MRKIRMNDEIEKDLLSLQIEHAKESRRSEEDLMPRLNSEQKLKRCVSGILRYMREAYHPHLLICNRGYDRKDETLVLKISDETFLNTSVTVKVRQDLEVIHQGRGFYSKSELRVLDEFLSCWNKVVM